MPLQSVVWLASFKFNCLFLIVFNLKTVILDPRIFVIFAIWINEINCQPVYQAKINLIDS